MNAIGYVHSAGPVREWLPSTGDCADDWEFAAALFPEAPDWAPVMRHLAVFPETFLAAAARASENGSTVTRELLASRVVDEQQLYAAIAAEAGVDFIAAADPDRLIVSPCDELLLLRRGGWHAPVKMQSKNGETSFVIAPEGMTPMRLRRLIESRPNVSRRLLVTTPTALRQALLQRAEPQLSEQAIGALYNRFPDFSARIVLSAWQGAMCGACLVALPVTLVLYPIGALNALHVISTLFFLACVALRFLAVKSASPGEAEPVAVPQAGTAPTYSVLITLYKEAAVVPELVAAIDRIVWPRGKLQVLLVCERDDTETIAAIQAVDPPAYMEIVQVPPSLPRTKPKALSYALPLAKGEFIVLYDAEDDPHSMQLVEAWQRFDRCGPDLACLQAPLEISNPQCSRIARMFAFEYSALFHGLLPWLARRQLILPLGGTSNHFRRAVLDHVGGWDPFNVTEDADLGLRLARFGYRAETLSRPTREAAPLDLKTWLPQRTRWLKGWLQTWFVHMRAPLRLLRELGPGSFAIAQVLFAGMIVSALVHPMLVMTALVLTIRLAVEGEISVGNSSLLLIDIVTVVCGYVSFLILGRQTLDRAQRRGFWKIVVMTPVYWIMMSAAAWRAVFELWLRPHHWQKTQHLPRSDTGGSR